MFFFFRRSSVLKWMFGFPIFDWASLWWLYPLIRQKDIKSFALSRIYIHRNFYILFFYFDPFPLFTTTLLSRLIKIYYSQVATASIPLLILICSMV